MSDRPSIDRYLALEAVRVTEAAALAAARLVGRGDERAVDRATTSAMHRALGFLAIDGTVVIGEGEAGEAGSLFTGEKVGGGGPGIDVALDPLEGATITARGGPNAVSVIAMAAEGCLLRVPDVYMEKIAVGTGLPADVIDLDATPAENLASLAKARNLGIGDLVVCVLDRPRHSELIARIREAGARIMLISDGDVSGVVATARPLSGVDMYLGSGGAPEGVLAAAALGCVGGQMQARMVVRNDDDRIRLAAAGHEDPDRRYTVGDMVSGEIMFAATGVTDGAMLPGVKRSRSGAVTHSIVMRSTSGTVRIVEAWHDFSRKAGDPGDSGL